MKRKFKTKIKATDESQITDQTIGDVIKSKIEFVIEQTKSNPPYITWLSKNMILWGGKVFNALEDNNPLKIGFISAYNPKTRRYRPSHLPGRMPTYSEQEKMEMYYGVALPWPPRGLFEIIQNTFRNIEDSLMNNDDSIVIAPCRGYINREGKLIDPAWNKQEDWAGNQVSGYLIYRKDKEAFEIVKNYLLNEADRVLQLQVERTKITAPALRESRSKAAATALAKSDRRIQRIKSLNELLTPQTIEDWKEILSIEDSEDDADNNND